MTMPRCRRFVCSVQHIGNGKNLPRSRTSANLYGQNEEWKCPISHRMQTRDMPPSFSSGQWPQIAPGRGAGRACHDADRRRWITVRNRYVTGAERMLTLWSCKLALIQTSEYCRSNRFRLLGTSDRDRNNTGFLHWEIVPSHEQRIAYEDHFFQ